VQREDVLELDVRQGRFPNDIGLVLLERRRDHREFDDRISKVQILELKSEEDTEIIT
jgi:hypothetical protein